jgi:hypothetical protein
MCALCVTLPQEYVRYLHLPLRICPTSLLSLASKVKDMLIGNSVHALSAYMIYGNVIFKLVFIL